MAGGSRKAIIAAFFANAGISVAKFAGFAFTGSASMLAEGVHSVADPSNQGLLLLGGSRAKKAATEERVRAVVPQARVISLEPDIARSGA